MFPDGIGLFTGEQDLLSSLIGFGGRHSRCNSRYDYGDCYYNGCIEAPQFGHICACACACVLAYFQLEYVNRFREAEPLGGYDCPTCGMRYSYEEFLFRGPKLSISATVNGSHVRALSWFAWAARVRFRRTQQ
jgi:hypothetical protein